MYTLTLYTLYRGEYYLFTKLTVYLFTLLNGLCTYTVGTYLNIQSHRVTDVADFELLLQILLRN